MALVKSQYFMALAHGSMARAMIDSEGIVYCYPPPPPRGYPWPSSNLSIIWRWHTDLWRGL